MDELEQIVKNISELNGAGKRLLMLQLFEKGAINFTDVATAYVKTLENENTHRRRSLNTLALMLASYCISDASPGGKNARSHLYESGAFTEHDGAPFGKQLASEFNHQDTK